MEAEAPWARGNSEQIYTQNGEAELLWARGDTAQIYIQSGS
jgi:hypothetical protein